MAHLYLVTLVTLAVLASVQCTSNVELEFYPAGVHKKDDTIKIVCRASNTGDLVMDVLKIIKRIDEKEYEISTNDYMQPKFQNSGRYSMAWVDGDDSREASATIKDAQGEDSGMIGCKHELLDGTTVEAFEEFKIVVPPKSVTLKHYRDGEEQVVTDERIVVKEGEDSGIECEVVMDGSHDSPQTSITLDQEDVMHKFSKEEDKTKNPNGGLVEMTTTLTYEYLFKTPDLEMHGKRLECSSVVDEFDPLKAGALIEVHYAPRVSCEAVGVEPGEKAVVTCTSQMNPELDLVSVSWKRETEAGSKSFVLTQTEPELAEKTHRLNVTDQGEGKYIFELIIDEVKDTDFGKFKFEVQNSHSMTDEKVKLHKVTTTTTTTTTTTKPLVVDVSDPQTGAVGRAGASQTVSLLLFTVTTLMTFLRS